ncbi:MAG: dimethylargininase [Acidimicrobiia bacterium]|nr:dimethylargininase [Acidimicrobiia bacterium]
MTVPIAFVRGVPDSFVHAIARGGAPHIDVVNARSQHTEYCRALSDAGYAVELIAADEAHPDCPFLEDAAVVLSGVAIAARPGAESRRGEVPPVAEAVGRHRELRTIEPPGTVDGGDVLWIGDRIYIGRSERTNDDGIAQFARFAAEVGLSTFSVDVHDVLHLKSAVSYLGEDTVLIAPGCADPNVFAQFRIIEKAADETHRASTLVLGERRVLMTTTASATMRRVADAGFDVVPIDMSEFQAADGGLTCLSILLPPMH